MTDTDVTKSDIVHQGPGPLGGEKILRKHMTIWYQIHRVSRAVGFIVLLTITFVCSATSADDHKQVMLLHSFGPGVKPWSDYAQSIHAELKRQSPWPLDITDHSLVSARSSDQDPEVPFVEYLSALFSKRPLDLIVSVGAPAAAFVQRHRHQLFTTTPMVLSVVEQRRVQYSTLTENGRRCAGSDQLSSCDREHPAGAA